jgi:hypothetical protein
MLGLIIEVGIRTGVWILTKTIQGGYYLCFGNKEQNKTRLLEQKVAQLEEQLKEIKAAGI